MSRPARRVSVTGVLALVALFVSLGGVSAAATGFFSGRQIANHTIPLSKLTPAAVRGLRGDTGKALLAYLQIKGQSTAAGVVTASGPVKGKRMAAGVYQLDVAAGTFKPNQPITVLATPRVNSWPSSDPLLCEYGFPGAGGGGDSAANGSASVGIGCFLFSSGRMAPADSAFSFEIAGPPPG